MTKQEQIKEMAEEIFNSGIVIHASDLALGLIDNDDHFHRLAKYLYAAGYQKGETISYQAMIDHSYIDCINQLECRLKEVRKKTAKEFAEQVKMAFYAEFDELIPSIMADKIDELLKEYEE